VQPAEFGEFLPLLGRHGRDRHWDGDRQQDEAHQTGRDTAPAETRPKQLGGPSIRNWKRHLETPATITHASRPHLFVLRDDYCNLLAERSAIATFRSGYTQGWP